MVLLEGDPEITLACSLLCSRHWRIVGAHNDATVAVLQLSVNCPDQVVRSVYSDVRMRCLSSCADLAFRRSLRIFDLSSSLVSATSTNAWLSWHCAYTICYCMIFFKKNLHVDHHSSSYKLSSLLEWRSLWSLSYSDFSWNTFQWQTTIYYFQHPAKSLYLYV